MKARRFIAASAVVLASCSSTTKPPATTATTFDKIPGACELHTDGTVTGECSILQDPRYDVIYVPWSQTWSIEPLADGGAS